MPERTMKTNPVMTADRAVRMNHNFSKSDGSIQNSAEQKEIHVMLRDYHKIGEIEVNTFLSQG
jgi:hypothetical protein